MNSLAGKAVDEEEIDTHSHVEDNTFPFEDFDSEGIPLEGHAFAVRDGIEDFHS